MKTSSNGSNTAPALIPSFADLKSLGAEPTVLSLEDASVPETAELLTSHKPDAVIFAAGAGGKGDKSRTRKVDYEGAVKVYDAMEISNIKRLLVVGAVDIRNRDNGYPEHYSEDSSECMIRSKGSSLMNRENERQDVGCHPGL